jgi:hypothetical protein
MQNQSDALPQLACGLVFGVSADTPFLEAMHSAMISALRFTGNS